MSDASDQGTQNAISQNLYNVDSSDPDSELVDRSSLSPEEVTHIGELMKALFQLRETERAVAAAAEKYMKLSSQDMRALHYLIVANNRQEVATPGMIAAHLNISPASTTKLLNRLERDSHIVRRVHPVDRRAFAIDVTPETRATAMQTMGRQQSKRFHAAARLSHEEREVVIRFLADMTQEISLANADWADASQQEG
ncbi:MarR family winged helix-turn-helix transcriptional regulator [Corynebacterium sp. A21]|uniref:MarR family winged helix-turn-helix transcriptional regulator n=1 Tax=Corynebacterium sp. A21 TaxID=3457318 RepID=UPI003FD2FCD3